MFKANCKYCGVEFEYRFKSEERKFCSHKCASSAMENDLTYSKCAICGKEISYRYASDPKTYCSRSCSNKGTKDSRIPKFTTRKIVNCVNCGKAFSTFKHETCSRKCKGEIDRRTGRKKRNTVWFAEGYKFIGCENNKAVREHTRVMENYIGRKLLPNECIHHKNENRSDNRIENLQLMTRGEHTGYHARNRNSSRTNTLELN